MGKIFKFQATHEYYPRRVSKCTLDPLSWLEGSYKRYISSTKSLYCQMSLCLISPEYHWTWSGILDLVEKYGETGTKSQIQSSKAKEKYRQKTIGYFTGGCQPLEVQNDSTNIENRIISKESLKIFVLSKSKFRKKFTFLNWIPECCLNNRFRDWSMLYV